MALQQQENQAHNRPGTGIVLQVAEKRHIMTANELAKYPNSVLSKLATSDIAASSDCSICSSADAVKVLQLDSLGTTPLAEWPESAATVICSLYRFGCISMELLDNLLVNSASSSTPSSNSRSRRSSSSSDSSAHNNCSSTRANSSYSSSSGRISSTGPAHQKLHKQLLILLDYLQLSSGSSSSSGAAGADAAHCGIVTQWLPRVTDVPLRYARVLRFLYYCFAVEAVQIMLDYKPHGTAAARCFSRRSSAAFVVLLESNPADPSLSVHELLIPADLAANGLRTAASSQVFSGSNSAVIRNVNAVRAKLLEPPTLNAATPCGDSQSVFVKDIIGKAISVSHPLFGQAMQDALLACISGTGLHAGFTYVKGDSEAAAVRSVQLGAVGGGVLQYTVSRVAAVPVWVLWW